MDSKLFLKQLLEKLKLAGLPLLEADVEIIYKTMSAHIKEFPFENEIARAVAKPVMEIVDNVALHQINKIDGQEG